MQVAHRNILMGVRMNIRPFNYDQDLDAVLELWRKSAPGIQMSPSDEPAEIRKKLQRDPDLFLIAEESGEIIGAVMGGYDGRRGMIYHLAVDPSRKHEGLGRALMEKIEDCLRGKGCLKYYLLVTKKNHQAITFYESLGCEVMDLYVMGKVIQ
jgi:ribosomal protein S18 acetylase RimI-like enzyme